jgi:hypothetical protein
MSVRAAERHIFSPGDRRLTFKRNWPFAGAFMFSRGFALKRTTGLEPATFGLGSQRSTN